jgi:hypothetical protein
VVASLALLGVGLVLAGGGRAASYSQDEVVREFARQGFTLRSAAEDAGWAGYAPLRAGVGELLFARPEGNFYVYVAGDDLRAQQFFTPLEKSGGGAGVFDALQGNVVVSSDASLTDVGLTKDERRRIRAALRALDEGAQR